MALFLMVFIIMLLIVAAMSVGVLLANKPIKGTCGGISALGLGQACDICGGDRLKCDTANDRATAQPATAKRSALVYDAAQD